MIIDRNESEVTVLGDVQKYKVGIDERNINHIVTILSSNLYSHPMQSFLRETVSNAIDSHIEAGVDEPIIITITDNDIAIRDFGTGISPERFQEIYTNIGSSTKRDTNDYIGSFGIGRFSCLSVSTLANITSFYNGKAYYYVMNKDIDQLHIDLLFEKDTNEHNGVEVKIPYKENLKPEDWMTLSFIKNIYIEDERKYAYGKSGEIANSFNKRKIQSYKTFKVSEMEYPFYNTTNIEVLVGCIPYKVDYDSLWNDKAHRDWRKAFDKVYPCLNIGDVDVTPNREGLLYSEKTKKALMEAYDNTIIELTQLWDNRCNTEFTDFKEFLMSIRNHYGNTLILDNTRIELPDTLNYKALYKGFESYDFKTLNSAMHYFMYYSYEGVITKYSKHKNELQKGKASTKYNVWDIMKYAGEEQNHCQVVAVPDAQGFSSKYIKGFLSEAFGKDVLVLKKPKVNKYSIKYFIKDTFGITTLSNSAETHLIFKIIRELLKWFDSHVKSYDIIHSQEYLQYKEDHKEEKTRIQNNTKIPFHIWYSNSNDCRTISDTPDSLIKRLKGVSEGKCRIVYAPLDSVFIEGLKSLGYPNLIIVGLSQNYYTQAEKGMFPSLVSPIENLYSEDNRHLQRMAALKYIRDNIDIKEISIPAPAPIVSMSRKLVEWNRKYAPNIKAYNNYELLDIVPKEKYDCEIMAIYHQIKRYLEIDKKLVWNTYKGSTFFWYSVMKSKKMRIDYGYYQNTLREDINEINKLICSL